MYETITWYITSHENECCQNKMLMFCRMKCRRDFYKRFKRLIFFKQQKYDYEIKQKIWIHEYIIKFFDFQVYIMDMNGIKVLNVFEQGLKNQVQKKMLNNRSIMNKAIKIAQQISGFHDITHGKPSSNVQHPTGPTSIELENLWRSKVYTSSQGLASRFGGDIWRF